MGAAGRRPGKVHREHSVLRDELVRLERLARRTTRADAASRCRLRAALDAFLGDWGPRLAAHVLAEEQLLEPRLLDSLPVETGTLETFRHERETFGELLDLLRQGRDWLDQQEAGAEAEVAAALGDLVSLWTAHVRRADVLAPLLSSLEDGPDA